MNRKSTLQRFAVLGLAVFGYLLFNASFLYLIGFVMGIVVPKSLGTANDLSVALALPIDVALLCLFGLQHSGMARSGFKDWMKRYIDPRVHRSIYVLSAVACLGAIFLAWQPMPAVIWDVGETWLRYALLGGGILGWITVVVAVQLIDERELVGLKQAWAYFKERQPEPLPMVTPGLYKLVRHPIYLGFLIAFWCTPTMTLGRLVFASGMSAYILIGVRLEERDLLGTFGARYRAYRERVGMLLPRLRRPAREGSIRQPQE